MLRMHDTHHDPALPQASGSLPLGVSWADVSAVQLWLEDGLAAAAELAAAAQPVAQPVRLWLQLAHRSSLRTLVRKHVQHSAHI